MEHKKSTNVQAGPTALLLVGLGNITDGGLKSLASLQLPQHLSLTDCIKITNAGFESLATNYFHLTNAAFECCLTQPQQLLEADLRSLAALVQLYYWLSPHHDGWC